MHFHLPMYESLNVNQLAMDKSFAITNSRAVGSSERTDCPDARCLPRTHSAAFAMP